MCCSLYLIIQSQGGREYKGVGETARVSPTPLYFMRQGRGHDKAPPLSPSIATKLRRGVGDVCAP